MPRLPASRCFDRVAGMCRSASPLRAANPNFFFCTFLTIFLILSRIYGGDGKTTTFVSIQT